MRVFLTGGTGFIGGRVVRQLRERGDEVRALARSVERGAELERLGCELVIGDLAAEATIAAGLEGCDALIHGAAIFEVGIPEDEHRAMYEAGGDFTSYYEQTKYEAHQVAERLIAERQLPCVIVQPGGVYGPDDHSAIGQQINQFLAGRMPLLVFPDLGMNMAHVDDIAAGILLALDKGRPGESYILGGEIITMRELMATVARVAGKRPPTRAVPTAALRALAPVGPLVGKLMGQPPNLRELISSGDGVTFWAKHDKAIAELGYSPRGLESGLRDTFEAEGKLPVAAA